MHVSRVWTGVVGTYVVFDLSFQGRVWRCMFLWSELVLLKHMSLLICLFRGECGGACFKGGKWCFWKFCCF